MITTGFESIGKFLYRTDTAWHTIIVFRRLLEKNGRLSWNPSWHWRVWHRGPRSPGPEGVPDAEGRGEKTARAAALRARAWIRKQLRAEDQALETIVESIDIDEER